MAQCAISNWRGAKALGLSRRSRAWRGKRRSESPAAAARGLAASPSRTTTRFESSDELPKSAGKRNGTPGIDRRVGRSCGIGRAVCAQRVSTARFSAADAAAAIRGRAGALTSLPSARHRPAIRGGSAAPHRGEGGRGDQRERQQRELPHRDRELDAPVERLTIHDEDQDEAQDPAEHQTVSDCAGAHQYPLARQHPEHLPAAHADVPQHAEFRTAGKHGGARREAHPDETDDHGDRFERIGNGEGAVEDGERALAKCRCGQYLERTVGGRFPCARTARSAATTVAASAWALSQREPSFASASPVALTYALREIDHRAAACA